MAADRPAASPSVGSPAIPPPQVVHYGDRVTLWRSERNVRIQMSATAEGAAAAGEEVKLRITGAGANGDAGWRVTGIVRGPGDVEMEP
jgi:flagella basal body P-ring formation protein FlgA